MRLGLDLFYALVKKHLGIGMLGLAVCLSVCRFRHNLEKSLGDIVWGLYCTDCLHWLGPWHSTCLHTVMGRTQSGIEQEYWHERQHCSHLLSGDDWQWQTAWAMNQIKNFSTKIFPAEAYSCLQVCVMNKGTLLHLHGPRTKPQMDHVRIIEGDPCSKWSLKVPFMDYVELFSYKDLRQQISNMIWGQSYFCIQKCKLFDPPPPSLIRVNLMAKHPVSFYDLFASPKNLTTKISRYEYKTKCIIPNTQQIKQRIWPFTT